MSNHSFVTIPAEKARELAEQTIRDIKACRERDRAEYLASEVKRVNSGRLHRLFRMKDVTEEDIVAREKSKDCWSNQLWWIETRYGRSEELAERVIVASKLGDPITLSLEDAERLA